MEPSALIHHLFAAQLRERNTHTHTHRLKRLIQKYARLIRELVVAMEEAGTAHTDLALRELSGLGIRVRKVGHLAHILELDLKVGERRADVAALPVAGQRKAQARRGLRETVALQHGATKDDTPGSQKTAGLGVKKGIVLGAPRLRRVCSQGAVPRKWN